MYMISLLVGMESLGSVQDVLQMKVAYTDFFFPDSLIWNVKTS